MWFETKAVVLCSGSAKGGTPLNSFDNALRAAKIADFNIIRVTSIVPPGVPVIVLPEATRLVRGAGQMLPAVYETLHSDEPAEKISAGVGIGVPVADRQAPGVIFAYSAKSSPDHVESVLRAMIDEGMREMRLVQEYEFRSTITSTVVDQEHASAFAAAAFCDADLLQLFDAARRSSG